MAESSAELKSQIVQAQSQLQAAMEAEVGATRSELGARLEEAASSVAQDADTKLAEAKSELGSRMDAAVAAAVALHAESGGSGAAEESGDGAVARASLYEDVMRRSDEVQSRMDALQSRVDETHRRHSARVDSLMQMQEQVQAHAKKVAGLLTKLDADARQTAMDLNADLVALSERLDSELGDADDESAMPLSERLSALEAETASVHALAAAMGAGAAESEVEGSLSELGSELALEQLRQAVAAMAEQLRALGAS